MNSGSGGSRVLTGTRRQLSSTTEIKQYVQCATLLHCIGDDATEIYATFTFTADKEDKIKPLLDRFQAHFTPKRNITYERHRFNSRVQQQGETFDSFITDVKTKAKSCEFGMLQDSLIKDRIVYGILDDRIREQLLRTADLTLDKAIETCQAAEQSRTQLAELAGKSSSPRDIHGLDLGGTGNWKRKQTRNTGPSQGKPDFPSNHQHAQSGCGNCGTIHMPRQCPAFGKGSGYSPRSGVN